MSMIVRTICVLSLASAAQAFLNAFAKEAGNPALAELAKVPSETLLDLRLEVGNHKHSRMNLQGLHLILSQEDAVDIQQRPALPGADGPNAGVSSGAKSIVVRNKAFFVDMTGRRNVPLNHGCWEMVWRDNAPAGVIICGFELEESIHRNDAFLKKGRIYMSLPVWTRESLEKHREYRKNLEARVKQHEDEQKEAFDKMHETSNPIMKALHFRNAAEASERLSYISKDTISQIPLDEDVMALSDDLLMTTKGTVWSKDDSMFGVQHTLLGTVTIRPGTDTKSL